jgi:quercetin dioxygenase-like cupin family protein
MGVPRHTHTREDETYYLLSRELEVIVGDEVFVLREGDTLIAPRDIPHQLRNSGNTENHYLLMFSPSGFEGFLKVTAVPALQTNQEVHQQGQDHFPRRESSR